jgi:hypothetical protein
MPSRGRPRVYATKAEKIRAYRQRQRLRAVAPDAVCCVLGSCTLYLSPWQPLYPLLPRPAAVVTDPPYAAGYDWTWPHHCGHIWELVAPHLSSRPLDLQGFSKGQFYTSL